MAAAAHTHVPSAFGPKPPTIIATFLCLRRHELASQDFDRGEVERNEHFARGAGLLRGPRAIAACSTALLAINQA